VTSEEGYLYLCLASSNLHLQLGRVSSQCHQMPTHNHPLLESQHSNWLFDHELQPITFDLWFNSDLEVNTKYHAISHWPHDRPNSEWTVWMKVS
jgi:hypothetical protein